VVGEDSVADSKPIVVITPLLDISELVVRVTAPVTQSLVNTVSWVAHTEGGLTATASALARVNTLARVQTLAYYDVDRDGIVDPLEMGVGNVTITLESPLGISQTVRTDAAGAGGFDSLANGQYTLTVSTDDLTRAYSVDSAFRAQPLDIAIGQLYTATFPLILPDETDSDRDSLYDYIEGPDDFDRDGIPNYLDPDNYLFMPLVKRE
ncbi:MAG TPA: SdrD B-like domain-containing protein, partial [Caldilineaceae bacterium]|nr:SdrD B-like domain-containing protein [Caldilineaceae bacterium]